MFTDLAAHDENKEVKARHTRGARKAYGAIVRFLPRVGFRPDEMTMLQRRLASLELELRKLGETSDGVGDSAA